LAQPFVIHFFVSLLPKQIAMPARKDKILVIGASGQIGVELTLALRKQYGNNNVVASDLREEVHM
jgi:NADPH:quinone reductase-like Zn-dependent oxidoreductase